MIPSSMVETISTVGFPIGMCLLIWFQCNSTIKENTKAIRELTLLIKGMNK